MITVERMHLWCFDSYKNSDKVYNIELQYDPASNLYDLYFEYGRRGKTLITGTKLKRVSKMRAESAMRNLSRQKINKGYDLISHDNNLQIVNIAPYVALNTSLKLNGVITQQQADKIHAFLTSEDNDTIIMATNILTAKRSLSDLQNVA